VEKEQEERKDAELSTNTLKRQLASSKDHSAAAALEIEQYRTITGNLRRGESNPCRRLERALEQRLERDEERELLDLRAFQTATELDHCQKALRCIIEGIDKDQLLVRFTHIDPSDLDREFSLVLDVSDRTYKGLLLLKHIIQTLFKNSTVIVSTPMLPTLPILLDELNQTRDVYNFIKRVRQAFVEMAEIK
jgi:kinetochore protein Spc25